MSDKKRYYWLKLPEDFYDDDTIQWIEDQENGAAYVNFYLKLLLKSLSDDGRLIRYVGQRLMPYDVKSLARLTNTDTDTVRVALELFVNIGLVERLDTGELYMNQIDEMIGSETQAATRMRKMRARKSIDVENKRKLPTLNSDERNNVTDKRNNVQKCYTDIRDRDIEIRDRYRDKDIETEKKSMNSSQIKQIISLWNSLDNNIPKVTALNAGTKRYKLLTARINEYGIDDVIKAIKNIRQSRFLQGYVNDFAITFDWFVRPNNFVKVLEGNYTDKKPARKPNSYENTSDAGGGISESTRKQFEEIKREMGM
ncbi:phage replisome organizer N-terminal domain-containing protein [Anaerococcus vaginimassiliensis]|uniref:phage replisome organizer N-terminal domain-containing protein n=1 Tax=Anaerococcus vaginimassiliensis TaxID=2042308 RepID=UPI001030525B|nr:phage replisome organizer N-terminal domain-containing protein [Anaerococcus vaginimassiliensis]